MCNMVLQSASWSIQNQVPVPFDPTHTDPPPASKILTWHKGQIFVSMLLSMLSRPFSPYCDASSGSESYIFSSPSWNKECAGILPLHWYPPDNLTPSPPKKLIQNQTYLRFPLVQELNHGKNMQYSLLLIALQSPVLDPRPTAVVPLMRAVKRCGYPVVWHSLLMVGRTLYGLPWK